MSPRAARRAARPRGVWTSLSEEDTLRIGRDLARTFKGNEVVFLVGELGAGKTVFAKGIAEGLGLKETRQVCSPSYTLLNIYEARVPIYHFDLYRLEKASEILDLGWEDYLDRGIILVEWGEKLPLDLPGLVIKIEMGKGNSRKITRLS